MTLTLTVDQINIVLNALGNAPYVQVANLIAEIQKQAEAQLDLPTTQAAAQAARDAERGL
jgi:hypothetical protein